MSLAESAHFDHYATLSLSPKSTALHLFNEGITFFYSQIFFVKHIEEQLTGGKKMTSVITTTG